MDTAEKKPRTVQEIGKELLDALCQLSPTLPDLRKGGNVYAEISVHGLEAPDCIDLAQILGDNRYRWTKNCSSGMTVDAGKEVRFSLYLK